MMQSPKTDFLLKKLREIALEHQSDAELIAAIGTMLFMALNQYTFSLPIKLDITQAIADDVKEQLKLGHEEQKPVFFQKSLQETYRTMKDDRDLAY